VPRATYLSVLIIGVFYTISTWAMVQRGRCRQADDHPAGIEDPTTFIFSLSDRYVGGWLTWIMSLLFISSVFAALLAFHNAAARYSTSLVAKVCCRPISVRPMTNTRARIWALSCRPSWRWSSSWSS